MDFLAIILDVGSHMFDDIENISSIIKGIDVVKGLIQKKLFSESKDELAIITCGTHDTNNCLNNNDPTNYNNIVVERSLAKANWDSMTILDEKDSRYGADNGDLLEAIVVAADHLVTKLRSSKLKGTKRVVLISNLEGETDFSQLDTIISGLAKENIELNVISDRDFFNDNSHDSEKPSTSDDHGPTESQEKMSQIKSTNEKEIAKIISRLNGATYSFDDVMYSLDLFETKSVKPMGWKANLEISDVCHISVVGYLKIKVAKMPTLKLRYGGDPTAEVETKTSHHLNDGNSTNVSLEDTIKGFKYGNSLIPFTEDDIKSMELSTVKSLKLIGFCEEETVPRHLCVGESSMVFMADNPTHEDIFNSLVHAMYECNAVALVRRVSRRNAAPRLASLTPVIKKDSVCLVYLELAFGEDIRSYVFPSLPFAPTEQRTQSVISETQLEAVSAFIDHLMMTTVDTSTGKEKEMYKPSKIANPSIQMFYQNASHKFLNPTAEGPELNDQVMSTLQIPVQKQEGLDGLVDAIKSFFPLKNKEAKTKRKKVTNGESTQENGSIKKLRSESAEQNPLPFGDIVRSQINEVSYETPIEDFVDLLRQGKITVAIDGMQKLILKLLNESYLDSLYSKALTCLSELRNKVKDYCSFDEDIIVGFNDFMQNMKKMLLQCPSRCKFWSLLKKENINLIGDEESEFGCSSEDKQCFFDVTEVSSVPGEQKEEDMDTLFEDM